MPDMDEADFEDFLSQIDEVNATIQGLKDGKIDVDDLNKKEAKISKAQAEKDAKREAAKREAQAKAEAAAAERKRREEFREQNREKLEELKENYYLRKARRERWEQFREENKSRAFSDYYKGWDLFEEDPDEELFADASNPAAVQDQAAFDAMAKDIDDRTKSRQASKAAADKERDRGNLAFKAGQYTEALACYSRAIEHFKGDKAAHSNRAACHIKLRNFLSALDDCSRVVDISTFLDDDSKQRPPPPPLLKAYVRRATANAELGKYEDAAADLATALEMAPEKEIAEIRRQQKVLKEEADAAKREAALEGGGAAAGGATAEMRTRVRELLEIAKGAAAECVSDLTELFEAVAAVEAAERAGGDKAGEARARAANAALARSKSEAKASAALTDLATMARESAAARVCVRHAGGVKLLLGLLADATASHSGGGGGAATGDGGEAAGGEAAGGESDEAKAARSLWAMAISKVLALVCLERRTQLEFHVCGGTTQLLRELRRVVRLDEHGRLADGSAAAESPSAAASLAALTPQLRMLSVCAQHETVAAELRRLAAGEGTIPRLLALLEPTGGAADAKKQQPKAAKGKAGGADVGSGASAAAAAGGVELLTASAALLATLSGGSGAKAKQFLVPHAPRLCATLARHVVSSEVSLAEQAATCLGNLSSHAAFRKEMVDGSKALLALLQTLPQVKPGGDGEAILLPNALAALHNCSLLPDAIGFITTEETANALLPRLAGPPALARRAAAVLAKCATRQPNVIASLIAHPTALPGLVKAVVSEGAAHAANDDEPRVVDVTDDAAQHEAAQHEAAAAANLNAASAAAEEEAEEEMAGSALRILTACASRADGARVICEHGGLPALVQLLGRNDAALKGNAALCIAECAKEEKSLAVLAVQPIVPKLLDIAHNGKGQSQKNAAIALGRLAKNPRCLQAIRDNHGIEILARAMKGSFGNMGLG